MYRPKYLDMSNYSGGNYIYAVPVLVGGERSKLSRHLPNARESYTDNNFYGYGQYNNSHYTQTSMQINQDRYQWLKTKRNNIDHRYNNIIRENIPQRDVELLSGISQSQSFSEGPMVVEQNLLYRGDSCRTPVMHTSRLNSCLYMSPPSPHWTTVGNVVTVKRSTSMPGSRPFSVALPFRPSQRCTDMYSSMKKKCGPFQCLKHQFRRVGHKDHSVDSPKSRQSEMVTSVSSQSSKASKSLFKKKPPTFSNNEPNSLAKSRGIRKSISLLFSKSNRSSKSDPNIVDSKQKPINKSENRSNEKITFQHASRRNRSYESMLDSSEGKLSNDANKSGSYSDVQDSSSLSTPKPSKSVDVMFTSVPSEISLSDSVSVCSSEHQLRSQTTSCYGDISYRTNDDSEWKTVIGNVCRSNSKDSAIANSTLSGDGMVSQSKRISLTSTMSRTSDLTTASEDFHDSSYSSFNDLQPNSSQFSYSKPRLLSVVSNLQPIDIDYKTVESPSSSDASPSSDSSTETLRPLSSLHRRRFLSLKNVQCQQSRIVETQVKCLKRSHSWPGYGAPSTSTHQTNETKPVVKPPLPARPKLIHIQHTRLHTSPKMVNIQRSHLHSSPLLSQYSRLYSLRSAAVVSRQAHPSSPIRSSGQVAPMSPNKYAATVVLRAPRP